MDKITSFSKQKNSKILFFSPYFYPYISGITEYPYRLFSSQKFWHKTTCLTFKNNPTYKSEECINPHLTILRMPFLFKISKGFISPSSLAHFWKEVRKTDYVIINLPSFEGILLVLMAKVTKKPVIALLHCEVRLPFSFLTFFINFVLNCGVYLQLSLADKIIVETKDYFYHKWPYSLFFKKTFEILPLVNTAEPDISFQKSIKKMGEKYQHIIGFCGRISSEKGIEILIKSVSSLNNSILVFAGPTGKQVAGEELYYKNIQSLLAQNKIPHLFLGQLSAEELSAFYEVIDVLVLPSLNKTEAFGMVQVEAMLHGVPVVASNLPGVRVPILLSKMGILVPPNNSIELKSAIQKIISDRKKYTNAELVTCARRIFDQQKTYEKVSRLIVS